MYCIYIRMIFEIIRTSDYLWYYSVLWNIEKNKCDSWSFFGHCLRRCCHFHSYYFDKDIFLINEVLTLNMTLVFPKNVLNSYTGYCICYDVTHKSINFISFKDIADILFTV